VIDLRTEYSKNRVTLRSRVDIEIMDSVRVMARQEKRTLSNMVNVLLSEAIANRAAADAGS